MKVLHVVGARPNFMKVAAVLRALNEHPDVEQVLVHTGQHYDPNMSDIFFQQLGLPRPDVNLGVGSGTHAVQTAHIMTAFEPVLLEHCPDWVLVYGDVNSTVAASLVCAKLSFKVAHIEAGLRSFDRTMPEEINRLVTDQLSDLLFTPSIDGNVNLRREGIPEAKVHLVGNVMIDTLIRLLPKAQEQAKGWPSQLDLTGSYGLVTMHRPANVDDPDRLSEILATLNQISSRIPLLFPLHPRTRQRIETLPQGQIAPDLKIVDPLSYLEFVGLMETARLVITDSGGIQEETTFLGVPCLTVRENTERPVTVTEGTNILVGLDMSRLLEEAGRVLRGEGKVGSIPPFWDGHAGQRVADVLREAHQPKRTLPC